MVMSLPSIKQKTNKIAPVQASGLSNIPGKRAPNLDISDKGEWEVLVRNTHG